MTIRTMMPRVNFIPVSQVKDILLFMDFCICILLSIEKLYNNHHTYFSFITFLFSFYANVVKMPWASVAWDRAIHSTGRNRQWTVHWPPQRQAHPGISQHRPTWSLTMHWTTHRIYQGPTLCFRPVNSVCSTTKKNNNNWSMCKFQRDDHRKWSKKK